MHFFTILLTLLITALAAPTAETLTKLAPIITARAGYGIPGKYIIKLKEDASNNVLNAAVSKLGNFKADHVYRGRRFKGFAGKIEAALLEELRALPHVEYIEEDAIFSVNQYVEQTDAPWGLGRISHKAKGSTTYVYDDTAGAGTCAYVIDTGIYTAHSEFGGRATFAANFVAGSSNTDDNGHGTHVAGTIGSSAYGVAKETMLYGIKVLAADASGSISDAVAGILFVTEDVASRSCPKGTVVNISLGGRYSAAINAAAAALVEEGFFLAVSAGNSNTDASGFSPASEPSVCTVGATDENDAKARFSNYGSGVDIQAPGTNILSTWIGSTSATKILNGTSMATPFIAGLGAYLLALLGKKSPADLCSYIQSTAISGSITGLPSDTINSLAFNGNPSG